MEFIDIALSEYCESHTKQESDLLKQLNRETHLKVSQPRMLSGHLQGRFLSFISKLVQPKLILEIGTYTGYSALCLAEGLLKEGKLITIDPNEETNHFARQYFNQSNCSKQIEIIEGQALDIIPTLENNIDLVFIDADKKNYLNYYKSVIDKVKNSGLIIADNVLWSGKVITDAIENDRETKAIHEFNNFTSNDERVESLLLPVRDGLMILRKK